MFFQAISNYFDKGDATRVTLHVVKEGEGLRITIMPTTKGGDAASTPMSLAGSAADLDAGIADVFSCDAQFRKSLSQQVAEQQAAMKQSASKTSTGAKPAAKQVPAKPQPVSVDDLVPDETPSVSDSESAEVDQEQKEASDDTPQKEDADPGELDLASVL